ncbi:hypothetical protein V9T40_002822 [Parthenolecanium corni]|uniref:Nidogen n=1 Tax=Parthenolecanium corni TaxID=536013 RepID=A0AAN9TL39_9HEMI
MTFIRTQIKTRVNVQLPSPPFHTRSSLYPPDNGYRWLGRAATCCGRSRLPRDVYRRGDGFFIQKDYQFLVNSEVPKQDGGVFSVGIDAVPLGRFYSYGPEVGDSELPKTQHEVSSPEISLRVPIKYYGESYTSLFVNSNGLISFLTSLPNFINVQFPLDHPVIAPFYANTDLRASGSVFYRETQNELPRARITAEIRQSFPYSQFSAESVFVATWYRVGYFNLGADKVNTFQCVIASSGNESFVELLYTDDGIQWLQGVGQSGTGLPDAKAQAGFVAYNGRKYELPHSGTDQIRNLMRLSNLNEGGLWLFRIGDIGSEADVEGPGKQPTSSAERESSCATGYTSCHSQATCVDSSNKYCCLCRKGFYGNGYNCLKDGTPIRASGKVNIDINGMKINQQDLQAYIVVADGRPYTAISKIPITIGRNLQALYSITAVLNWLFAVPTGSGLNGFQITGGVLNHTAEITFKETNDRVFVTQRYLGLDVFDQLKLDLQIQGRIPVIDDTAVITIHDYQIQFNFIAPGQFKASSTSLAYKVRLPTTGEEVERQIAIDQTVTFKESCSLNFNLTTSSLQVDPRGQYSYYRLKTARNFVSYEARENILRFAATSKVSLLSEQDDPCIEGRVKCVVNSSCVVEGNSFRCVCHPGFRTTYANRYTENRNYEFGCLDENECNEGTANCDQNAICVNEIGSFRCACRPGYTGNGYQCIAIESPCGKDFKLCNPPNSYCSIPDDYRTCECNPGYQKNYLDEQRIGFTCADINECESRVCTVHENCLNLEGGYVCECKTAPGSRRNCKNLNVSCNDVNNCSPNADCILNDVSNSYGCRCIRGYYGDGYFCKAYGGRSVVPRICTNTGCFCPPNFVNRDDLCIESGYYAKIALQNTTLTCNNLANMCHPRAQCIYNGTLAQYQCACNAGYEGNGFECVETEISCLRNDICDPHATCKEDERTGRARCVCNKHYAGDGTHCDYAGTCSTDSDCNAGEECFYNDETLAYECKCQKGFVKTANGECRQLRTCSTCHPFGRCVQDPATRDSSCECLPGYEGDGVYTCNKVLPPCNVENNCSPYAKCEQTAVNKFECRCRQGFVGNGTTCFDARTCAEVPEFCDRNARCLVRTFGAAPQCECNTGFTGNGSICTEIPKYEGGFLFVNHEMTTLRIPYEPSIIDSGYPIQMQANQIATGIAVDCVLGRVYWSDYNGHKIKSSSFKGKNITTLIDTNVTNVEGLAIDWINRFIYWTDSGKKVIESANLDGTQRKLIIPSNLANPRGIAVHPYLRKLFWSDWNRVHPKLEWSNVDGSDRSIFLTGPDVQVPNSVTIDWYTNELCWADAGTKRILCANISTRQYRLITDSCISPFSLTASPDKYYWTEWVLGKIGFYEKRTRKAGNLTLPLVTGGTLYGIVNVPTECP